MNHVPLVALASLLLISGCTERENTPDEDVSRLERIEGRFNAGDYTYVQAEAEKYVREHPRSYRGWAFLGWAYLKSDRLDEADECFDKALQINPQWDNAYVGKGVMYRMRGDMENARKSYLEAIRIVPDNAEAFSSLLVIEVLEGNNEKAVEYGEKAWALRNDLPTIPANLAVAYHYLGDHSKRDRYYQHAERLGYNNLDTLRDIFEGKTDIRDR